MCKETHACFGCKHLCASTDMVPAGGNLDEDDFEYLEACTDYICFQGHDPREDKPEQMRDCPDKETRKLPPCGNPRCKVSTFVDEVTLTFGSGELSDYGTWEHECPVCAADWLSDHPNASVMPRPKK